MPRPRIDAAGLGGSGPMGFKGSRVRIPPSRPLISKDFGAAGNGGFFVEGHMSVDSRHGDSDGDPKEDRA